MTPEEQAKLWAHLSPRQWLAGADQKNMNSIVVRWNRDHRSLATLPCGVRWDALTMPEELGLTALAALLKTADGPSIGPVLLDRRTGVTVWLLPVGLETDVDWLGIDPTLELLGPGRHVEATDPDYESPDGTIVHWAHWPRVTGVLTQPVVLQGVLQELLALKAEL